jgi:hypothetical protein
MICALCDTPLQGKLDTFGNCGEEVCLTCHLFFATAQAETKRFQDEAAATGMSKMEFLSQLVDTPLGLICRGRTDLA